MYAGSVTFIRPKKQTKSIPPVETALIARLSQECDARLSAKEEDAEKTDQSTATGLGLAFT